MASVKDAFVAVNMDLPSGSLQWNVSFICLDHNWEVDVLASFYSLLYSNRARSERKDKFGGLHLAKGSLILDLSTRSLLVKELFLSLGRVFDRLWLIDAACAN
jgi:hypothetical protein